MGKKKSPGKEAFSVIGERRYVPSEKPQMLIVEHVAPLLSVFLFGGEMFPIDHLNGCEMIGSHLLVDDDEAGVHIENSDDLVKFIMDTSRYQFKGVVLSLMGIDAHKGPEITRKLRQAGFEGPIAIQVPDIGDRYVLKIEAEEAGAMGLFERGQAMKDDADISAIKAVHDAVLDGHVKSRKK